MAKTPEEMRVIARTFKGPKSMCQCGHTGDGANSQHMDTEFVAGHGECGAADCECVKFTWKKWTKAFARRIR